MKSFFLIINIPTLRYKKNPKPKITTNRNFTLTKTFPYSKPIPTQTESKLKPSLAQNPLLIETYP